VCEFLSLLASLVHCCAVSPDYPGGGVYPYGLCTTHRGPCIANYITTLLGLKEYTGIITFRYISPPYIKREGFSF
jgi:hypothetical protein